MNPALIPLEGGEPIEIAGESLLIGREPGCDLCIDHKSVSKTHCVVLQSSSGLHVRDLCSTNGTWINGKREMRGPLRSGDLLGVSRFVYRVKDADSRASGIGSNSVTRPNFHLVAFDERDLIVADWKPGLEVFRDCVLLEMLGEGGFGKVWRARRRDFGDIALKWIQIVDPTRHEGRGGGPMRGLRHRHLIRVYGCRRKDNVLVVALELADETLEQRFRRCRAAGLPGIPADELLRYLRQVGKAIDYLYFERRLLHRDVKPSNILLLKGVAKLGDVGLAKILEKEMGVHSGFASFDFAPPEFFEGKMVASSDQFSLASTYCYLLTGQNPFPGADIRQVAFRHVMGKPNLDGVPLPQHDILHRALARNPQDRFESCSHFISALRRSSKRGGSTSSAAM